jgi:phosphatidylinositol glycan class B
LRSYLHPLLFAILYKGLQLTNLDTTWNVVHLPRVAQATFAAIGDFFLWKLSKILFPVYTANWILLCQLSNWFLMYAYTRTFSNSLETVFVVTTLYYWIRCHFQHRSVALSSSLHKCEWLMLIFGTMAILIRTTSVVIWSFIVICHLLFTTSNKIKFIVRLFIVSSLLFTASFVLDSILYEKPTFVMWNFFRFNVVGGGGSFYGTHPAYWYFTHALPTVTFSFLFSTVGGCVLSWHNSFHRKLLSLILWYLLVFSVIAHKEFRFLMPILPLLMLYSGYFFSFWETLTSRYKTKLFSILTFLLILLNFPMAFYFMTIHQRGTIEVMFRLQEEARHSNISVHFLMPCHSTPYYAYIHRNISMEFLDCSPKLGVSDYADEADRFFANPNAFLQSRYAVNTSSSHSPPSHFVFYDVLLPAIRQFLDSHAYSEVVFSFVILSWHFQFSFWPRFDIEIVTFSLCDYQHIV